MMAMAFRRSSSRITNGGAKRTLPSEKVGVNRRTKDQVTYMLQWVGFARTPRLLSSRQNCHAVRPLQLFSSSMTTALRRPLPRTSLTKGEFNARIPARNISPRYCARSASFSSTRTRSDVIATAHPRGLPPYVLPCSPGWMQYMTSRSARTAETGYTAQVCENT